MFGLFATSDVTFFKKVSVLKKLSLWRWAAHCLHLLDFNIRHHSKGRRENMSVGVSAAVWKHTETGFIETVSQDGGSQPRLTARTFNRSSPFFLLLNSPLFRDTLNTLKICHKEFMDLDFVSPHQTKCFCLLTLAWNQWFCFCYTIKKI